jgi:hypothetical protein
VQNGTVILIDFEKSRALQDDRSSAQVEMESLHDHLVEETGRGGGFRFVEEAKGERKNITKTLRYGIIWTHFNLTVLILLRNLVRVVPP